LAGYKLAYAFRVLFFVLIPLIFVKQVYKHIDDYFELSLWLAMLMSYGLHRKFKHKALFFEFYFFVIIASVINIMEFSAINVGVGILTFVTLLFIEKVEKNENLINSEHSKFLQLIPYLCFGLLAFSFEELSWLRFQNSILIFSLLIGVFLIIRNSKLVKSTVNLGMLLGMVFGIIGSLITIDYLTNYLSLLLSTGVLGLFIWNYQLNNKEEKTVKKLGHKDYSVLLIVLGIIVYTQFLFLSISFGLEKIFVIATLGLLLLVDKRNANNNLRLKNTFKYVNILIFLNISIVFVSYSIIPYYNAFLCYSVLQSVYLVIKRLSLKSPFSKLEFNLAFIFGLIGIVGSSFVNTVMINSVMASLIISLCLGYVLMIKKIENTANQIVKSVHVFLYQVFVLLVYISLVEVLGYSVLSPIITILLVIHAIILLFSSLKRQNKMLNKLSLICFVMALIKVVAHDIRDFSGSMKIVVLIVLGILLLAASYAYVKLKEKYIPINALDNELDVLDESDQELSATRGKEEVNIEDENYSEEKE